ncbi:hypothetical protein Pint_25028 [Pistacia integerrima]|uniref:Uncharacterized protein n=1 Tax=Pistacia integerrima TaxID=434235 RepID=A0ACC0YFK2_9ROSI|nr:hypothetical protein Pint_25028 [Pistacia integerrima]
MVCSVGSGRMAVMARLLEVGRFSPNRADEVTHQKLAAQNIYRELRQADEANLLDEEGDFFICGLIINFWVDSIKDSPLKLEDMHVFGLKPLADPLHLVCCNACKKPVKASQYAAHAGLLMSLNATGEPMLDVYSGTGNRKPPRKERKKLLTAYATTPVVEQERPESIDDDSSSLSVDVKRNSASVDTASVMVASRVSPENIDHSACVMPPPAKRSKMIADEHLPLAGDPESVYRITKVTNAQDPHTCKDFPKQTTPRSEMPDDNLCKSPGQVHEQCMRVQDFPVPLATKIYYSQRNNRLKSALTHLYHEASSKEQGKDVVIPQAPCQSTVSLQTLPQGGSSQEQVGGMLNKKLESSLQTPDQILAQNSEVLLGKSGGCLPATNFSNQFQVDNVIRSQNTSVGLARSKYLSKAYPFAGNSGKLLGNMQQPNGSVPVV